MKVLKVFCFIVGGIMVFLGSFAITNAFLEPMPTEQVAKETEVVEEEPEVVEEEPEVVEEEPEVIEEHTHGTQEWWEWQDGMCATHVTFDHAGQPNCQQIIPPMGSQIQWHIIDPQPSLELSGGCGQGNHAEVGWQVQFEDGSTGHIVKWSESGWQLTHE